MSKLGSSKNLLIGPTCFCWRCCRRTLSVSETMKTAVDYFHY